MESERKIEVTKEEFFATVGQLDVHPRPERETCYWHERQTLELKGISTPGYMCRGEKRYWIVR